MKGEDEKRQGGDGRRESTPGDPRARFDSDSPVAAVGETCDFCGAATLVWRKCKLICLTCAQINKSCADL